MVIEIPNVAISGWFRGDGKHGLISRAVNLQPTSLPIQCTQEMDREQFEVIKSVALSESTTYGELYELIKWVSYRTTTGCLSWSDRQIYVTTKGTKHHIQIYRHTPAQAYKIKICHHIHQWLPGLNYNFLTDMRLVAAKHWFKL